MSVLPPTPGLHSTFEDNNDELLFLLTDAWDNPLKDTIVDLRWTRDYLSKLTSLPLDELLREPAKLREEQAKAKRDAQQFAFRDYPAFLHAQTCRHEAEETLNGLTLHLGEFLSSVPELQEACEEFSKQAATIKEERGKITSVLEHQNVLTDLLEIPQLMETCVWNGYYSEAMDLASHVRLLQVRYPLSVVKSIQQQAQASSDLMLVQLISHLRKPIRLAAAMNVVGFLRRMDVFESETELRMVFLRCRHDFLQQRLIRVKRDISEEIRQRSIDAFEYLKRFIDIMREQMFEISNQYISIFSNEQGTLLSDYMVNITGLIKSTLHTYLPMIEDTSALTSLLTQLQYCGLSLGRIGLDFRHIFVHSFEEAVQPMILRWIDTSTEEFVKIIVNSTEEGSAPSTWMSSKIVSQNDEVRRYAFQPPMLLVGYPSLAIFTNGILSAFNALRLLPAVSLYVPIQNHLEACFLEIGNALKQYSYQAASHIPDEITFIQSFTAAFVRCCVPYLKSCLVDGIYGDLSVPSVADEDLELLLATYLPVVKKEFDELKEEENLTTEESSSNNENKETETKEDVNQDQKEALAEAKDTTIEDSVEADTSTTDSAENMAKDAINSFEEKPKELSQEDNVEEKENMNKLIASIVDNESVLNNPGNDDTINIEASTKDEEVVNSIEEGAQQSKESTKDTDTFVEETHSEEKTDKIIKKDEVITELEEAVQPADVSPAVDESKVEPMVEQPIIKDSEQLNANEPAAADDELIRGEHTAEANKYSESVKPAHASGASEVLAIERDIESNIENIPSNVEDSDYERKEQEGGVEAKAAALEKKPQVQKKSKKHKGKKGRR